MSMSLKKGRPEMMGEGYNFEAISGNASHLPKRWSDFFPYIRKKVKTLFE
jgi:hypothetical protein